VLLLVVEGTDVTVAALIGVVLVGVVLVGVVLIGVVLVGVVLIGVVLVGVVLVGVVLVGVVLGGVALTGAALMGVALMGVALIVVVLCTVGVSVAGRDVDLKVEVSAETVGVVNNSSDSLLVLLLCVRTVLAILVVLSAKILVLADNVASEILFISGVTYKVPTVPACEVRDTELTCGVLNRFLSVCLDSD